MPPLLEVRALHSEFHTGADGVRAADGISNTVTPEAGLVGIARALTLDPKFVICDEAVPALRSERH